MSGMQKMIKIWTIVETEEGMQKCKISIIPHANVSAIYTQQHLMRNLHSALFFSLERL